MFIHRPFISIESNDAGRTGGNSCAKSTAARLTGTTEDSMMLKQEVNAMRLQSGLFALAIVLFASSAHAGDTVWFAIKGNDTGGIIPWSPWVKHTYRTMAADFCAQYYKVAHITSVHPWYGDFVGFTCAFPRHYDPVKTWYLLNYGVGP
jgi:hypothetical protein